jgi:hypothetical protein
MIFHKNKKVRKFYHFPDLVFLIKFIASSTFALDPPLLSIIYSEIYLELQQMLA